MSLVAGGTRSNPVNDAVTFYGRLVGLLAGGERLALCSLLRLEGSGPRRAGAKMLFRENGESLGTVGGGLLEAQTIVWAEEALRAGCAICRPFALSLQQASDEGMTCGGQAEVLVEPLDGTSPATRDFYDETLVLLRRGGRGCLVTAIAEEGPGVSVEHFLVVGGASGAVSMAGRTLPTEILASAVSVPTLVERGAVRYFLDPLTPPITVVVFGGGHIARHLVPLCHLLGFRTAVVDDRPDFVSRDRFPHADELLAVPSFENALQDLPLDAGHYVVIVTRGHGGDQAILRQALRRRPGYIGMIGSRRKRGLIFEALAREGVVADDLARVVCPIGLSIGAETPEEIAISIAAELVATRAARTGRGAAR
ncbi:MAG: XdhC family protein [candidate division NC10 bacterium]|nr:XdhC family protein [candidate division NC10 bacterium]